MTSKEEFKAFAHAMVDYIIDYHENIKDRRVLPTVKPGYLRPLIPSEAPEDPETWEEVMKDIDRVIMPGVTHWHSPQFHAYFPTANSYPAIVADMLSDAIGCIGFSWIASPACTELEMVMMDWLGQMLNLPEEFLFCGPGRGGGVIQGTASEATLVALLSAKAKKLEEVGKDAPEAKLKLVAYASAQAHSSVERAGLLGDVIMRLLQPDEDLSLRGETLAKAIKEDLEKGLIPFYVVGTLGTTNCCSYDNLVELGQVCQEYGIWMHVDAAYAGSAFICPEYRPILNGVEYAESFNFNPHKWMLVTFDCSAMWVKDAHSVAGAFNVDPLYLKHQYQGQVPDYRHWHVPLGRRFRSLKMWFVLRLYGQKGLREYVRKHVRQAHEFEEMLLADERFEVTNPVTLGLVCFRLKGSNELNENLNKTINDNGKIHVTPCRVGDKFILRFAVCSRFTESEDIQLAYDEISEISKTLLLKDSSK